MPADRRHPRRPQRTTGRELDLAWRVGQLAALLRSTLESYADTVGLHDDCPACRVDVAIHADRARDLGLDPGVDRDGRRVEAPTP